MRLPAVYKWVGKIGYTEILHSPVNGNEGEYPVAVKVDIADLKRGQIVLPGAMDFINTRRRTFYMSPTAKLSLIFQPHDIHTYLYNIVDGEIDPSEKIRESEIECREAPIMESTTIISKHRKNFKEAP